MPEFDVLKNVWELQAWVRPVKALVAAFVFGQLLAWTYEVTYRGLSYSRGFAHTLVLSCLSAAILVLSMHQSLIAGLGLLGVLSMIRFRTTLKAPRDLVFVMGSATVGVACGVDAMMPATVGAVGFSVVALYLHFGPLGARQRYDGVLRFRIPCDLEIEPELSKTLDNHCRRTSLLSISEVAQGTLIEHTYQIKFWHHRDRAQLLQTLRRDLGAEGARVLLQEAAIEY